MNIKDTNITINVSDLDQSIHFYISIGFTLTQRWGDHYAQMSAPGVTIGLHPSESTAKGSGNVSIGFTSNEFEKVKSQLQQLSVQYKERVEEGGEFIHFNDPDGTSLYFIKPKW